MKLGNHFRALISTKASLGSKPGKSEPVLKSGAPKVARNSARTKTDKRMAAAAAKLQELLK